MNKKLLVFTVATCLFSWACWLPIVGDLESSPFASGPSVLPLFFLGAYGPTIMGIAFSYVYGGWPNVVRLLKSAIQYKVGWRWILATLAAGPVVYAAAVMGYTFWDGEVGSVNHGLLPWIPVVFVASVIFGPLAEEFGWRGFALPLLNTRGRFVSASIIIGFIWALWHAPLFWANTGTAISGFSVSLPLIGLFFLAVVGSSFIYTWVFNHTAGSVFAAVLLHLSMNASGTITGMFFPEMSLEQKFTLYQHYVVVVWMLVLFGFIIRSTYLWPGKLKKLTARD